MAISHFKLLPLLFLFHFNPLLSHPSPSFSFTNFDKDPNFESTFSLFGDAKVIGANGSSSAHIQLTHSVTSSGGRVMYKKPIKLLHGSTNFASFSTYFSFLMSPDNSLALILVPGGEFNASVFVSNSLLGISLGEDRGNGSRIVAVEYGGALEVAKYGGFVSVNVRNSSSASTMLSSGKRLHSWVDYQAGSKRLEVRLSQFGEVKPLDSLLSYPIDLSRMWSNDQEVLICLSSSNGNASQSSFLYSWSFQLRQFPHWMHSQPLDPNGFDPKLKPVVVDVRRGDCGMKVIAALIMGVGFGALGAFMGVNLCNMLIKWKRRLHVGPEECSLSSSSSSSSSSSVHPVDFEYEKVKVVTVDDKVFKDGK